MNVFVYKRRWTCLWFLAAVVFGVYSTDELCETDGLPGEREKTVYRGLKEHAERRDEYPADGNKKVVVGFGGCRDWIVPAVDLLSALDLDPQDIVPQHHDQVTTLQDLGELFVFFFSNGAAAERYISTKEVFDQLVDEASNLALSWSVGGNALLMGSRMASLGMKNVTLGARLSSDVVDLLPMKTTTKDGLMTRGAEDIRADDIHIILEYQKGDIWGNYTAVRANRLALHSDTANAELSYLDLVEEEIETTKPSALVIGGLQLMQNYPFVDVFTDGQKVHGSSTVLKRIRNIIVKHESMTTHFEFASVSDRDFMDALNANIFPYADSIGCNEQEIKILETYLRSGSISYVHNTIPRTGTILDMMYYVFSRLRKGQEGRLSRIHVHTLPYQIIMVSLESRDLWPRQDTSVALASLAATTWVCGTEDIDPFSTYLMMDDSFLTSATEGAGCRRIFLNTGRPVSCWIDEDRHLQVCIAPNLICKSPQKTIGAGDNISGAGLVPHF